VELAVQQWDSALMASSRTNWGWRYRNAKRELASAWSEGDFMSQSADQRKALCATWWRVPEEDTAGLAVYRKEGTPLPPARGRYGFTLNEDGRATLHGPGPTDRRENTESHWQLDAQGQLHVDGVSDATAAAVANLSGDTLRLKR
jgi:hypothetical protein